jgi:hypothetical protein
VESEPLSRESFLFHRGSDALPRTRSSDSLIDVVHGATFQGDVPAPVRALARYSNPAIEPREFSGLRWCRARSPCWPQR